MQATKTLIIILAIITMATNQNLSINNIPKDLQFLLKTNNIKLKSSPIGFQPRVGTLHGKLMLATPFSACQEIQSVQQLQNYEQEEDIFILADDTSCLESVKARNIAASGAYIGIIKKNINNSLYDKQVDGVHIPILQMQPNQFTILTAYMITHKQTVLSALADFNPQQSKSKKKINIQLWLSPNQKIAYKFMESLSQFFTSQSQYISFHPRYVLHSKGNEGQYIGCLSNGRFCAAQLQFEGKLEGKKIVSQSLRQIIIASKNITNWYRYAYYYGKRCLGSNKQTLWQNQNSQLCSENVMLSTNIQPLQIGMQYNTSFRGPRPQVDSNMYLEQQRQLYLQQKITKFPILLINQKPYQLENAQRVKLRICNMIDPQPSRQSKQCQKITNAGVFSWTQILSTFMVVIILVVFAMMMCNHFIRFRMRRQLSQDVNNTLAQYYRYMDTLSQPRHNQERQQQPHPHQHQHQTTQNKKDQIQLQEIEK